ncbi:MAG TPA: HD domain-containing phosphohydrolase [Gammaproteobacteria bacterium]|nr:HD domain-containing phosphohydrolase [Gammaproteobacteria bacterium]
MAAKRARVLFVDDEPHVLSTIRRSLVEDFDVHTAESGGDALALLEGNEPFSVIVADCRMPKMNGIELLTRVAREHPDTVRMMLTGNTDQATAVQALNKGEVFKFLNKPCDTESLRSVLQQGVRQHQLVTAERELLEQTLHGSIKALGELLSIAKPEAFGRTDRIRRKARELAALIPGVKLWELDTAALLSQLGCIRLSTDVLDKIAHGKALSSTERAEFAAHAGIGSEVIARIPRLEHVAQIILYQNKNYDGTGWPHDDVRGDRLPLEARVLRGVMAHDELASQGWSETEILVKLAENKGRVDPAVLKALEQSARSAASSEERRVLPSELEVGMILQEDVKTDGGMMLLCRGAEVTKGFCEHLKKLEESGLVTKRFLVAVPA